MPSIRPSNQNKQTGSSGQPAPRQVNAPPPKRKRSFKGIVLGLIGLGLTAAVVNRCSEDNVPAPQPPQSNNNNGNNNTRKSAVPTPTDEIRANGLTTADYLIVTRSDTVLFDATTGKERAKLEKGSCVLVTHAPVDRYKIPVMSGNVDNQIASGTVYAQYLAYPLAAITEPDCLSAKRFDFLKEADVPNDNVSFYGATGDVLLYNDKDEQLGTLRKYSCVIVPAATTPASNKTLVAGKIQTAGQTLEAFVPIRYLEKITISNPKNCTAVFEKRAYDSVTVTPATPASAAITELQPAETYRVDTPAQLYVLPGKPLSGVFAETGSCVKLDLSAPRDENYYLAWVKENEIVRHAYLKPDGLSPRGPYDFAKGCEAKVTAENPQPKP